MFKIKVSILSLISGFMMNLNLNVHAANANVMCFNENKQFFWLADSENSPLFISVSGEWEQYAFRNYKFKYFILNGGTPMVESLRKKCNEIYPNYNIIQAGEYNINHYFPFAISNHTFVNSFISYTYTVRGPDVFAISTAWKNKEASNLYPFNSENIYLNSDQVQENIIASRNN